MEATGAAELACPIASRRDGDEEDVRAQPCTGPGNKRAGREGTHVRSVALPKEGFILGLGFPSLSLLKMTSVGFVLSS